MLLWVICETCLLKCKFQVYEKMYLNILLFIAHEPSGLFWQASLHQDGIILAKLTRFPSWIASI